MSIEDDVARSLPPPPRPAPGKRTATIDLALRRFDGADVPVRQPARIWSTSAWASGGRRYAGALASLALIALIGVPAAWNGLYPPTPVHEDAPAARDIAQKPVSGAAPDTAAISGPQIAEALDTRQAPAPSESRVDPAPQAEQAPGAKKSAVPADQVVLAEVAPPPPARADAPIEVTGQLARGRPGPAEQFSTGDVVVTGSRVARPAAPAPALRVRSEAEESSIVVTGGRARRGDWNACTVDDPSRSLDVCRAQLNAAAKGRAGLAAAHINDGLSRAWSGDLAAAITAFDRAVATAPNSEAAHLNRGLAHRRSGNLGRALSDLDRAVRYAPRSARAYYNRSRIYQEMGATARASEDVKKAIALDPRYADIAQ
ncbi:tetratricopeptide repeat protein [Allosphingosinicella deserti]|nr:tetratricopeptide repeat protein [Sphingomonas deserti]